MNTNGEYSTSRFWVRTAVGLIVSMGTAVATFFLLRADEGLSVLLVYTALVPALYAARLRLTGAAGTASRVLYVGLNAAGAVAIAVSLNLTPASAYLAWFRLVQGGNASGVLSFMFAAKAAFFSALLGSLIIRYGAVLPVTALASMYGFIMYAIFQQPWIAVCATVAAGCSAVLLYLRHGTHIRKRTVTTGLQLLTLSALVAWPISALKPGGFNVLVKTFSYETVAKTVIWLYPDFPFLYNMPGYGHQLGEKDIGGTPSLTVRPVFEVTANPGETIYLRTAVYEIFQGTGWAQNAGRMDEAREGFSGFLTEESPADMIDPVRVEVAIDFFSSIPHTVDTSSVNLYRGDFPELQYGSRDLGFVFEVPVVRGTTFYLNRGSRNGQQPEDFAPYLKPPKDTPEEVAALAADRWADLEPRQAAESIKDFLAANYLYTLETSKAPRDMNALWYFLLEDGRGYCVQFATAFTMLARLAGIPARYVTGFLVTVPSDGDTTTVTGYSSHAWSEIWVPDTGWVVQEATPPMDPRFYEDPMFFELYNPFDSSYTARQLQLILGDRVAAPQERDDAGRRAFPIVPVVLIAAILAVVSGIGLFVARSTYAPITPKGRIKRIGRNMINRGANLGVAPPSRIGWLEWADSIRAERPSAGRHVETGVRLLLDIFFGGRHPERRDVRFIRGVYARVFRR